MKSLKIHIYIATLASLVCFNSHAGSFYKFGIANIDNNIKNTYSFNSNTVPAANLSNNNSNISDNSIGFSAAVGKKFNFKHGLFLTPTISYDYFNNSEIKDQYNITHKFDDRIATYLNAGYSNKKFSFFILAGLANTSYEADLTAPNSQFFADAINAGGLGAQNNKSLGKSSGRRSSSIFGIGTSYKLNMKQEISIEYSKQEMQSVTKHYFIAEGATFNNFKTDIETISLNIINYF